jgi:hypothetical protein
VRRAGAEERTAGGASLLRGRPARHHPAAEPGRSQAHQNLNRLFFFSHRVRCVVGYSFGLEGAAWLSRVWRGLEGAAWLSRVRRGRPPRHHAAAEPGRSQAHQNLNRLFAVKGLCYEMNIYFEGPKNQNSNGNLRLE